MQATEEAAKWDVSLATSIPADAQYVLMGCSQATSYVSRNVSMIRLGVTCKERTHVRTYAVEETPLANAWTMRLLARVQVRAILNVVLLN